MKTPYVLALDLGTTGNRAIVFDQEQNIISQCYEEFPQIYPKPGWVEHDAIKIWQAVKRILEETFAKVPLSRIASIGITNQRETIVVWDKDSGKPVYHAIVWQCRRTTEACAQLKKKGLENHIHQKTGLFLDPYFSATKIAWILKHVKGAKAAAASGRLLAGTIDSWVIWKLSAGRFHITDSSNASRTLLFNIHKKAWDKELCRIFEVPESMLPGVVASSAHVASMDKTLFGAEVPITGIAGDQQAASFAQGCFSPGIIKNTYGTGLFALTNTGKTPHFSKHLLSTVAWSMGSLAHTEYAMEGSVFIGGAAVQWLRDGLGIIKKAGDTEKMVRGLKTNEGVYFVPALVGMGAPFWDPTARGAFFGLTRGTGRAHLVRAALEAIAYQTRDIVEALEKDLKHSFKRLRVDGGASANDLLMQFQADLLGFSVERPQVLETTALGAAGLAGIAVGVWKDKDAFNKKRKIGRTFTPRRQAREMQAFYEQWQEAARRSLRWQRHNP